MLLLISALENCSVENSNAYSITKQNVHDGSTYYKKNQVSLTLPTPIVFKC